MTFHDRILIKILSLTLLLSFVTVSSAFGMGRSPEKAESLCPHFAVKGQISPGLSSFEKRLICGDPGTDEKGSETWRTIPLSQAQFHFRTFLEERGYHHSKFEREGENILVTIGEKTPVRQVILTGADQRVSIERKRDIVGSPMTPKNLESIEGWVRKELERKGDACPQIQSEADPSTGEIKVDVVHSQPQTIVDVTEDPIEGLKPETLSRYYAFEVGDPFDIDLLNITEARINQQGIVQSNHFQVSCDPAGVHLNHRLIPGLPRLVGVGFGINTEGAIRGRIDWRHTRLGGRGSLLNVSAMGSFKVQTFKTAFEGYFLEKPSRWKLSSAIQLMHENQEHFETLSGRVELGPARTWDTDQAGISLFVGPAFDLIRTIRGEGTPLSQFLNLESRASIRTHDFELYANQPHQGYQLSITTDLNHKGFFSDVSAQRISLRGESLWNYKFYDPALWIFGVRGGFATLFTEERATQDTRLPGNFLQYLGGSTDLRGFGLQELPRKPLFGGLSSAFLGFEVRLANTLPGGLEPFAFIDIGAIGSEPLSFELPVYRSPGLGIRLDSKIGIFRTTLAHGFSGDLSDHFQFFFNYGEEF